MPPDVMAGVRLKLQRAFHHIEQLVLEADKWLNSNHNSTWIEAEKDNPPYFLLKARADKVPIDPFSLLLGDCLYNLRSGLDHLVYALAVAAVYPSPLPDDVAKASQFPIIGDEDGNGTSGCGPQLFKKAASRIQMLKPEAQAAIKRLQPFQLVGKFRFHPLWRLNELSNIDKHRFLHAACGFSGGILMNLPVPGRLEIGPGTMNNFTTIVEDETVIARIPISFGSQSDMEMCFKPHFFITVTGKPDEDIVLTIGNIYNYIIAGVLPAFGLHI